MLFTQVGQPRLKGSVRRPFTPHEDAALMLLMGPDSEVDWEAVATKMEGRSARQCRERWVNYLAPTIRSEPWTEEENRLLVDKINELGHCWATIGQFFNGRSENDVKNRWYSHLKFRSTFDQVSQQWTLAPGETCPMFPDRKKRRRAQALPQQNAIRILEEQKRACPFFASSTPERRPATQGPDAVPAQNTADPLPGEPSCSVLDYMSALDLDDDKQISDSEFFSNFGFDP